jgi:hypothetical protein
MARTYEIYVVDPVKASIWKGDIAKAGEVVSVGTDNCEIAECRACGILHGIAPAEDLERKGLAARRV